MTSSISRFPLTRRQMMHRQDGRQEIDRRTCIEVFYNQRRRHSTLGQISPAAFERRAAAA